MCGYFNAKSPLFCVPESMFVVLLSRTCIIQTDSFVSRAEIMEPLSLGGLDKSSKIALLSLVIRFFKEKL